MRRPCRLPAPAPRAEVQTSRLSLCLPVAASRGPIPSHPEEVERDARLLAAGLRPGDGLAGACHGPGPSQRANSSGPGLKRKRASVDNALSPATRTIDRRRLAPPGGRAAGAARSCHGALPHGALPPGGIGLRARSAAEGSPRRGARPLHAHHEAEQPRWKRRRSRRDSPSASGRISIPRSAGHPAGPGAAGGPVPRSSMLQPAVRGHASSRHGTGNTCHSDRLQLKMLTDRPAADGWQTAHRLTSGLASVAIGRRETA
jgi:hypothetical protein